MIINIFSDASVNTPHAGFAYWINCYQFEYQWAGYVHGKNIGDAETYSINHALESLLSREIIPFKKVNIYTDSYEAIHRLKTFKKCDTIFNLIELTLKNGMRPRQVFDLFEFHHVKAHTQGTSNIQHKNRWCDMMAKQHRVSKTVFKATIFDNSDILL